MPDLICEGPCNPTRLAIDEQVKQARRRYTYESGQNNLPLDDDLVAQLHQLQHTPHVGVSPGLRCTACGTMRRW